MSKASDVSDDSQQEYQAESDADTLQKHQEITSDTDRHQRAHAKLQERAGVAKQAAAKSGRSLHRKVKAGLKKAFPDKSADSTPFEKDGKSGGTPFDDAAEA
jgi:hypothetical protein